MAHCRNYGQQLEDLEYELPTQDESSTYVYDFDNDEEPLPAYKAFENDHTLVSVERRASLVEPVNVPQVVISQ
jgi:hypothetical protein